MRLYVQRTDTPSHRVLGKYFEMMKLHRTILEKEVLKTGVFRSQHQILMFLSDNPNASQKEIATRHNVSTATIAVSLKKLEKGGYVSRIVDQNDNRYNQICLTESGKTMVEKSRKYFDKVEKVMFSDFAEEEIKVMEVFLDRVCNNLQTLIPETEREE